MKFDVIKTKKEKNGGLTIVMDCDDEFIEHCVGEYVKQALQNAIDTWPELKSIQKKANK